jgi:glycosyltransferase involved in cell wall biosynthesis
VRLALIVPGFSADEADWCIPALLDLVRALARRHEVEVFPLRYPPGRRPYRVGGAAVHPFGGGQRRGAARLLLLGRALGGVVARGRRHPFDLLHGLWADEPGWLAVAAASRLRVPAVVSLMGGELVGLPDIRYGVQLSPVGRRLVRTALRRAARVTVGSRTLGGLAGSRVGPDRLRLAPLGVDTDRFRPDPPGAGPGGAGSGEVALAGDPAIVHVASLTGVKDQDTLLRALPAVAAALPGARLHLVGDGPRRAALARAAAALGLGSRVTFHGAVAHERLPAYYRAARVCVLASRFESQSLVTLEAAACARATVGPPVGLLPDLAPREHLAPAGDPAALGEALVRALRDPAALAARGRQARRLVEDAYALPRTAGALEVVYGEAAAARG